MSLTQLLPQVEQLSYSEKLQLLHWLSSALLKDSGFTPLEPPEGLSPAELQESFESATVLAKPLIEKPTNSEG